jgi:hypothetical protein
VLSGQAAFEVDGIEPAAETGWSVIVQGPIEEITSTAEIHRLERLELHPGRREKSRIGSVFAPMWCPVGGSPR